MPPNGSEHYNIKTVGHLAQTTDNEFGGSEMNWVGTESMQTDTKSDQKCDEQNNCCNKYITWRGEEVWGAWSNTLRTIAPTRARKQLGDDNMLAQQ